MPILSEARSENKMLKPDRNLPRREGESVLPEIRLPATDEMYGSMATDRKTADALVEMEGFD